MASARAAIVLAILLASGRAAAQPTPAQEADPEEPAWAQPDPAQPDPAQPDPAQPDPVQPDPVQSVAVPPDADQPPDHRPNRTGLWVAAAGGVTVGVSAFFWLRAYSAHGDLHDMHDEGVSHTDPNYQETEERMIDNQTVARALTLVGAAAVVGGLVYHFAIARPRERSRRPEVGAAPLPGGGMAFLGWTL